MRYSIDHPVSGPRSRPISLAAAAVTVLALAAVAGCGDGGSSSPVSATVPPSASSSASSTDSPSSPPSASAPGDGLPTTAPPGPTTAPVRPGSGQAAAAARCTVTDLELRLGRGDPGAGNVYFPLLLTNTSSRACVLNGFPGVSLIQGDGSVIGRPADRVGAKGTPLTLAPGAAAQADLHTLNQGIKGDACWRKPTFLKVYPPGSTQSMTLVSAGPVVCGDTFEVRALAAPH